MRSPALRKDRYEAIVVGSGFGGAVAACRLAQAGVDLAILERGHRFEPGSFPRPARANTMHWHRGHPRRSRQRMRVVERLAIAGRFPAEPEDGMSPRVRASASVLSSVS